MKQSELIAEIGAKTKLANTSIKQILDIQGQIVGDQLQAGNEVTLPGIGKFATKHKPARKGRNPRTGETIDIPEKTVPDFRPCKALKDQTNIPIPF